VRVLADEHVPGSSIRALREAGHDVVAVAEQAPGAADQTVLARAVAERRVVLTFDRDFGELLYRAGAVAPPGVVFFRLGAVDPAFVARVVLAMTAEAGKALLGWFTVVDEERIRQRALPSRPAA
jgi:predicted nuclease of predicted toxin-antitoxin system